MLPPSNFYAYNQSTCKRCIVVGNRERRQADPDRTTKRRARAARDRFRGEVGTHALGVVLDRLVPVFIALDVGELTVAEAQTAVFDLAGEAIRDAESRCGVEPGDGLDILAHRKTVRNHRDSA